MTTEWAYMPNAELIDQLLVDLRSDARDTAWITARDAASALVAYDDCGWMLAPSTSSDALRGLIRFNQDPAATLLLRYKLFLENRDGQTSS